jgi:hypothetical protein
MEFAQQLLIILSNAQVLGTVHFNTVLLIMIDCFIVFDYVADYQM